MSRQCWVSSLRDDLPHILGPSHVAQCPRTDLPALRASWRALVMLISLPGNFQWLVIAWRIKSKLLNLGIQGLLESDPNTYLSLDSVLLPSWLVTVLWTLAFPGTYWKVSFPKQRVPQGSACAHVVQESCSPVQAQGCFLPLSSQHFFPIW